MAEWQGRLAAAQDLASEVLSCLEPDSEGQQDIARRLEDVNDRWECLGHILEAQSLRVSLRPAAGLT